MANLRMTQTAVPFWSVRSRMAGGLETITGTAYGDSLVGAASRACASVRRQMARSGGSVLPLTAAGLACAVAGPFFHAPDGMAMGAIAVASALSSIAGFAFSAIRGAMLFHLVPSTVQEVQIMILCSIANQAAMTWTPRRDIDWRAL